MSEPVCFVYIMATVNPRDRLDKPVKVGIAKNPGSRLHEIKTACPYPIDLVAAVELPTREIALAVEKAFHEVMGKYRLNGEWFDLPVIEAARALCSNYRCMLESMSPFNAEEINGALHMAGVLALEQKIAREQGHFDLERAEPKGEA